MMNLGNNEGRPGLPGKRESLSQSAATAHEAEFVDARASRRAALNLLEDAVEARRTLEKLNVELSRLAGIVESSDDAILSVTLDGIITTWNRSAEKMYGYTTSEAVGQHISMIIPAERREEGADVLARVRRGERVEHFETERQTKDGRRLSVSLSVSPIQDDAGRVIGMSKIARDISERKRAEEALRESEERFRVLADSAPALIWVNGPQGAEFVSRGYLDFLGIDPPDVRGYAWAQFIHPDDRDRYVRAYLQAMERRAPFDAEFRFRRHDGEYRWMHSVGQPRIDARREFLGYSGITVDITERKHAEAMLEHQKEALEMVAREAPLPEVLDFLARAAEGQSDDAMMAAIHLLDREGTRFALAVAPSLPADYLRATEGLAIDTGSGPCCDAVLSRAPVIVPDVARDTRWPQFAKFALPCGIHAGWSTPIFSAAGNVVGTFAIYYREPREPSPQDQRLLQIVTRTVALAIENTQAATALREHTAILADLHRRKDEFLAMLSHELRNPLAPIVNALQLLRIQRGSYNPTERQARTIIERQVGLLRHLIDDLLEVSRITTGKFQLRREQIAVAGIVEGAVQTVRPLIEERRHKLSISVPQEPIWLHCDAARLEQVIVNLLTNAAKYTNEGGQIWLTAEREGETAVLRVRDTGIGIAPELLPRVFDLFTQAERGLDRSQGGLGIGLSLVQRLVDLHGGTVEAFSTLGQGSEFVVRLPTTSMPSPSIAADTAPPIGKSCRVLVVDDNVDSTESLAMLLKANRHDVRTVHDSAAALEAALDYRPDGVLLDIGLPGLSGLEVARHIRSQPTLENVVLIALTGYGLASDRQRSQEAGFDHHLVKPADFGQVQEILASVSEKGG
jgi:PAS domain S-box-containing protein